MGTYNPKLPTKHVGTDKYITFFVSRNRSPTGADYRQPETGTLYSIGTVWQVSKNPTTGTEGDLWMLSKIVANVGYWVQIASGVVPTAGILTLSDTLGTLVYPTVAGNIQLYGNSGQIDIVSDPANNRIVFSLPGGSGAIDSVQVQAATAPGVNPVLPDGTGLITVNGAVVANHSVPIETRSRALNAYNVEVQYSTSSASTDATKVGLAAFKSSQFSVDSTGFVSLSGSGGGAPILGVTVDAHTAPGTSPVVPNSAGNIIVTGGQVEAGTTANVLQTNSLAANTYAVQIQRSQAVGSSTVGDNGVCHFDSSIFSVDSNAFTSLSTSFYQTGTFTPTVYGATTAGTTTYVDRTGTYLRLGNTVFVQCEMSISTSTGTGYCTLGGLPFTCGPNDAFGTMVVSSNGFWPWPAGKTQAIFQVVAGTTTGLVACQGSNQNNDFLQMDNAGVVHCSLHYSCWYIIQ